MSYKYFSRDELKCKCGCDREEMDPEFMKKLISIREEVGFPMVLNSAYRCPDHNSMVSSTGMDGPHTTGRSIDAKARSRQKAQILSAAKKRGMTRFGIAKTFIHIDDLTSEEGFDEQVIWTY